MTKSSPTASKILKIAKEQINNNPGNDLKIREVCALSEVELPTLYHYFTSKNGLLAAVAEEEFSEYIQKKNNGLNSDDPIQNLRLGWKIHTEYGVNNPGLYILMYSSSSYVGQSEIINRSRDSLLSILNQAKKEQRISVEPKLGAEMVLSVNIDITLGIINNLFSLEDSKKMCEYVINALTSVVTINKVIENDSLATVKVLAGNLLNRLGELKVTENFALDYPEEIMLKKLLNKLR